MNTSLSPPNLTLDVPHLDVLHEGRVHRVTIKRHTTTRRYHLRVKSTTGDVILTMPASGSLASATDFAHRNAQWIDTRLAKLASPCPLEPGTCIPLRGIEHRLTHRVVALKDVWIEAAPDPSSPPLLCVSGKPAQMARRVMTFLKREAQRELTDAVHLYATKLQKSVKSITIKDQTSRWGSCSSSGNLSFSWRLILAPPYILDYLAAHEATHLVHMNHSAAFWQLLHEICPATPQAERWLKTHGMQLHRYGRM